MSEETLIPHDINLSTAPLHEIVLRDDDEGYNHPRRILQLMDYETHKERLKWYPQEFKQELVPISVTQLWEALDRKDRFKEQSWRYFQQFFGTSEMYADPQHESCIHGEDHLKRVPLYAYVLGQYKGITKEEMKVLLTAAAVHDMARMDDRTDPNHGLRSSDNFDQVQTYMLRNGEIHTVQPYINTYRERGIDFNPQEINQIKLLCTYHEKSWEEVPKDIDERTRLLIRILQIADAADRFRSPSTKWWPKKEYFNDFFKTDDERDMFLRFSAYMTLKSEDERFENGASVEDGIRYIAKNVGIVEPTVIERFGHIHPIRRTNRM